MKTTPHYCPRCGSFEVTISVNEERVVRQWSKTHTKVMRWTADIGCHCEAVGCGLYWLIPAPSLGCFDQSMFPYGVSVDCPEPDPGIPTEQIGPQAWVKGRYWPPKERTR